MEKVSLKKLLETGAHFGHQNRRWNPKMEPYIFQEEDNVHIFDLLKTKERLEEALDVLKNAAEEKKSMIWVGTKKQVREKIAEVAKATKTPYVNERWIGGTLTNFDQIKKSLTKLEKMKKDREEGVYKTYTKKERLLIDREIERLERYFGGISELREKPDLMVIVDIKGEKGAAKEANFVGVETIGIVDSNSDPDLVDYVIPMNDDAKKALDYVLDLMKDAILEGVKKVKKVKKEEKSK